jgi:ribonuclease HI
MEGRIFASDWQVLLSVLGAADDHLATKDLNNPNPNPRSGVAWHVRHIYKLGRFHFVFGIVLKASVRKFTIMSIEWMQRMGFPAAHITAMRRSLPGTDVFTDHTGTHITVPGHPTRTIPPFDPTVDWRSHHTRVYDPLFSSSWRGPVNPRTLIRYDPDRQVSFTCYSTVYTPDELETMMTSVAVFVDGGCKHNGDPEKAKAAYGCYFGPGSKFNESERVNSSYLQTSQVAEIISAIKALDIINNKVRKHIGCGEVVIVTDSSYVVEAMTKHIYKWKENGWKTAKKGTVKNKHLLEKLDGMIEELNGNLIEGVKFWKVPREMNVEADKLANEALDKMVGSRMVGANLGKKNAPDLPELKPHRLDSSVDCANCSCTMGVGTIALGGFIESQYTWLHDADCLAEYLTDLESSRPSGRYLCPWDLRFACQVMTAPGSPRSVCGLCDEHSNGRLFHVASGSCYGAMACQGCATRIKPCLCKLGPYTCAHLKAVFEDELPGPTSCSGTPHCRHHEGLHRPGCPHFVE